MLLSSLKSGKACGIDEIPNESLKYGGDAMLNSLLDLFTIITDTEKVPDNWHQGIRIIKPLHKKGGGVLFMTLIIIEALHSLRMYIKCTRKS